MENNIRWIQRFNNFSSALSLMQKFIDKGDELNELENQGLIKSFEYNYELAWNTIKDFYENQGETGIQGSKDAIQLAFKRGLIADGDVWMEMLKDRNKSAHTYNEQLAEELIEVIFVDYFPQFKLIQATLKKLIDK
ncbi:MAG: nucleotidyltransferase substrate binding protein [Saprospiraceae bacterium]